MRFFEGDGDLMDTAQFHPHLKRHGHRKPRMAFLLIENGAQPENLEKRNVAQL